MACRPRAPHPVRPRGAPPSSAHNVPACNPAREIHAQEVQTFDTLSSASAPYLLRIDARTTGSKCNKRWRGQRPTPRPATQAQAWDTIRLALPSLFPFMENKSGGLNARG